jgi:hypothetical protein
MWDANNIPSLIMYPPIDTIQILSEAFPDVIHNKEIVTSDNVKWFTLYTAIC